MATITTDAAVLLEQGKAAQRAARQLARADTAAKNQALLNIAAALENRAGAATGGQCGGLCRCPSRRDGCGNARPAAVDPGAAARDG